MADNQLQVQQGTSMTPAQQNITAFKKLIDGNYVQEQLKQVLKENAGTLCTPTTSSCRRVNPSW